MSDAVKVAVRIRPLIANEIAKGYRNVVDVNPDINQISANDKSFTYNYAFPISTSHQEFYNKAIHPMIDNLFKGFNVTILAYGQTGSGKTHTMGTSFSGCGDLGVIPRSVITIFDIIKDSIGYDHNVKVSFIALYNEVLYDLLAEKPRSESVVNIREDPVKGVVVPELTEIDVLDTKYCMDLLAKGSLGRATGSTNMNNSSSRSHAIFTINIDRMKKDGSEHKSAKFHLVDLAGSERSKKTGATGSTFKEGVNINLGLLALGNVISAFGDEKNQPGFVRYRDSN